VGKLAEEAVSQHGGSAREEKKWSEQVKFKKLNKKEKPERRKSVKRDILLRKLTRGLGKIGGSGP